MIDEQLRNLLTAVRVFKTRLALPASVVPPGTFGVLGAIAARDGSHVKTLAAECALDPSTVSRAAAALVKAGLVKRSADPHDGRASVLQVTDHGREALENVMADHRRHLADALRDWTPEELTALSTMLQRFTDDLMEAAR